MGLSPSRHSPANQRAGEMPPRRDPSSRSRKRAIGDEPSPAKRARGGGAAQRSRRGGRAIVACTSPLASFISCHSELSCYEEDVWTEVAKYLDGQSLARLATVNRWFHRLITDDSIWRYALLRDLQVPCPRHPSPFKWLHLYTSAFDGSHSYSFRQTDKHIDWMRIGAFFFNSPVALLTERLPPPRRVAALGEDTARSIQTSGACLLSPVRIGIWIADLQLVRCPVCNLDTCEGTMQVLDARHAELFLEGEFQAGRWEYQEIGARRSEKHTAAAVGGIFDVRHITSACTASVMDVRAWMGKADDWQPKARVCTHGVAISTNLQPNEGITVKFQVMRSRGGRDGEIVSVRISQQLI